jgi:hypothetical protein
MSTKCSIKFEWDEGSARCCYAVLPHVRTIPRMAVPPRFDCVSIRRRNGQSRYTICGVAWVRADYGASARQIGCSVRGMGERDGD